MNRREALTLLGAVMLPSRALPAAQESSPTPTADITLRIGPVSVELAPKRVVKTTGYNGTSPGPLLRVREGQTVNFEVHNETDTPNLVHWHGLFAPSGMDGAAEEGTPPVPPRGQRRYTFVASPAGTRWYHSHGMAGRNLKRATYSGEFGFLQVEPKNNDGRYDQEILLALKEWDPYMTSAGEDAGLNVAYKYFSINNRSLGFGEPIRVKQAQRVLFRILNASATSHRRVGLAGHSFQIIAMDGNVVPVQKTTDAIDIGPAERVDALVEMNRPGVWVFGDANDHDREHGMGIVVEYANQTGTPRWIPPMDRWDYTVFGNPGGSTESAQPVPLVFEKKFAGSRWVDKWTINGKEYPKTDPIRVKENQRYRLIFDNRSDEAHPVHLHRHSFELVKVAGRPTAGILKDVVVVGPKSQIEAEFTANNPGLTLFHCHQQMHMDNGFMTLMQYV